MKKKAFKGLVTMGMLLVVAASGQSQNYGGGRLSGTWDATVTITDCGTGDAITSFQSTANFDRDGTFTGITSGTPPAARTPEVGVWKHESENAYRFRFKAYLFNPAGTAVAYQIVTHSLDLSADNTSYTSAGGVKIFAMNGVQIGAGCSHAVGTRLVLD